MSYNSLKILLFTVLSAVFASNVLASDSEHGAKKEFKAGEMIMHHIADAHEIHFMTLNAEEEDEFHVSVPLPMILKTEEGWEVMSSKHFYHGEELHAEDGGHAFKHGNLIMHNEVVYYANASGGLDFSEDGAIVNDKPLDLSITKNVVGIVLTMIILLFLFVGAAKRYAKKGMSAPSGLNSWLEPLILFVRDEIAIPNIGPKKAGKFMPFLLTTFFFVWVANLLGLMSFVGGYNITGSLGVTLVLAFFVFVITNVNGNKHYWKHIVWPDGIPLPIKLILVPIEVVQVVLKPVVLMIRLTANITAGHIIILSFAALIFMFGQNIGVGIGIGVGSLFFMVFMFTLELLVAFIQAYVFTLLASMYFGAAVEEAHH